MTEQTREQSYRQIIEALFDLAPPSLWKNSLRERYQELQEEPAADPFAGDDYYDEVRHLKEQEDIPDAHELDDEEMAREAAYWRKVQGQEEAAAAAAEPQEPTQS